MLGGGCAGVMQGSIMQGSIPIRVRAMTSQSPSA
jgi:hypothetical protein